MTGWRCRRKRRVFVDKQVSAAWREDESERGSHDLATAATPAHLWPMGIITIRN